jgi:CyaY protein
MRRRHDGSVQSAGRRLADQYDFEADFDLVGALTIEFDEPRAKFVVSPQTPVRQVWVSAHSRSFELDWDGARGAFVPAASGQSLAEPIAARVQRASR